MHIKPKTYKLFLRGLNGLVGISFLGTAYFEEEWWLLLPGLYFSYRTFAKEVCTDDHCSVD
jgi:hypothetical protein